MDKILSAREAEIEHATDELKEKEQMADSIKEKYESSLKDLEASKEQTLTENKQKGYEEYTRIVEEAHSEAAKILDKAREDAKVESDRERSVCEAELKDMVVTAATKIAASSSNEAAQREMYDAFIRQAGEA